MVTDPHITMPKPEVTAVGRMLKPKHGEPQIHEIIAVKSDGTVTVVKSEVLKPAA